MPCIPARTCGVPPRRCRFAGRVRHLWIDPKSFPSTSSCASRYRSGSTAIDEILIATIGRTEIDAIVAVGQDDGALGQNKRAADRIANHLSAPLRNRWLRACDALDHTANHTPE